MAGLKILIAGAGGQLGWELQRTAPAEVDVLAADKRQLNLLQPDQVCELIHREQPDWIINAAAYTAVDKAEDEADIAYAINRDGARLLATCAAELGAQMLHISTDFVFNGQKGTPYLVDDQPGPLGVYGASKQAGDEVVETALGGRCAIIRTAWVYSAHGNNFVKTMLRLMTERDQLGIVADQIGSPTWANGLARASWRAVQLNLSGMHHWTDMGVASWYDFAVAIQEEALAIGVLRKPCVISPLRTADYPTPAARPAYSVLDKTPTLQALGLQAVHWRQALREMLAEL
ncbi:MAG: dTDP-4-dehydrorhamnose reductase [Chromatiales bacterium]|nr:dTDP-4-dehydrorhamnose reductase [Chromatiales bacterium]